MSYQSDRDAFMREMTVAGVSTWRARLVLRDATTIHRLAIAACNGDWPCDNGERPTKACGTCESLYHPSALTKAGVCPSCRAAARIAKRLEPHGIRVTTGGDPRGYTTKLMLPSGAHNTWGGREAGFGVPVRP